MSETFMQIRLWMQEIRATYAFLELIRGAGVFRVQNLLIVIFVAFFVFRWKKRRKRRFKKLLTASYKVQKKTIEENLKKER